MRLIRNETGDEVLRRVVRLYNVWKPEGRPPYVSFCLAKSLNLTGLLDFEYTGGSKVSWLGLAMKLWFTLTAGNGRGRWFGPRKGKTANQTPGSTRKKLKDLLELLAKERELETGCEKGTVETIDLTGWVSSDEGDDGDGAVAGTSVSATVEVVAKDPVKEPDTTKDAGVGESETGDEQRLVVVEPKKCDERPGRMDLPCEALGFVNIL